MKCLIDTHIILWLAENSPRLSEEVKAIILDEANEKYVSVASCWEVTIKISLKKLFIFGGINEFYNILRENDFGLLDIQERYLNVLESLPFYHRDPFDRLLIATAIADDLVLITDDSDMSVYKSESLIIMP